MRLERYLSGKNIGYVLMFLVFATLLYFILRLSGKLPETWNFFYILLIAILIILFSRTIKYFLEK